MAEVSECPNCYEHRDGRYCRVCGQNDRDYRRSLPPMLSALLKEAFELDGRLIKSLQLLFTKPGALSLEFSANRRASFVSPIRFYLFASILFFFALSLSTNIDSELSMELRHANATAPTTEITDADALKTYLDEARRAKVDRILADEGSLARSIVLDWSANMSEAQADGYVPSAVDTILIHSGIDALASPQRTLNELMDNLPVALFFLLPAYAFLLKLFYIRKHRYYVEHLVFALHLHTFAFIVFTAMVLLPEQPEDELTAVSLIGNGLFFGYFVYYFFALRRYYQQSRLATCFKFWLLLLAYSVLLGPSMLSVALVTVTML